MLCGRVNANMNNDERPQLESVDRQNSAEGPSIIHHMLLEPPRYSYIGCIVHPSENDTGRDYDYGFKILNYSQKLRVCRYCSRYTRRIEDTPKQLYVVPLIEDLTRRLESCLFLSAATENPLEAKVVRRFNNCQWGHAEV